MPYDIAYMQEKNDRNELIQKMETDLQTQRTKKCKGERQIGSLGLTCTHRYI